MPPIAKTYYIVPYLFYYDKCIIVYMYEFSFTAFGVGLLILGAGAVFTVYHQKIADNLAGGVSSYDRFKMWGLIACGIGFAVMLSLHSIILNLLIGVFFRG